MKRKENADYADQKEKYGNMCGKDVGCGRRERERFGKMSLKGY